MAWGRRCELGCESWPDEIVYARCLTCGQRTERWANLTPLEDEEARSLLRHAEFEKYYAKRCARIGIPVDGPLVESEEPSVVDEKLTRRYDAEGRRA